MEASGKPIVEIAKSTSHEADTDGITGYMYNMAVKILSEFWVYGEHIRRWHNGEHGVSPDKPGVVNSAVLVFK